MTKFDTPFLCVYCQHLNREVEAGGDDDVEGMLLWQCTAFPAGIPSEIMANRADHRQPYPGDNEMQFEQMADIEPAPVDEMFEA